MFTVGKVSRHSLLHPCLITRHFSSSPIKNRALPFSLSGKADTVQARDDSEDGKTLRMIVFGKPGAGKGTLSARLVRKYDIVSVSTGDLLRQHIAQKTDVGRRAEEIVASGGLVSDELMLRVLTSKLEFIHNRHWIIDGFPRTLAQGEMLNHYLRNMGTPLTLVVNLDVPDDIIMSRISDRWVHLPSGRIYNLSYNPPKVPGRDDLTGEPLTKRSDDDPAVFTQRLAKFYEVTSPLLAYFAAQASASGPLYRPRWMRMVTLSGKTSDEIWPQLEAVVRASFPRVRERDDYIRRRNSLTEAVLDRRPLKTGKN